VERYLPLVAQERQWHDRRRVVEFPLFPGYVFVRVSPHEIVDVTCVPSVVSMVMADGRPALVSEQEIENVRRYATAISEIGEDPEPHPLVDVGHRVIVSEGPFSQIEGTVVEIRGGSRIVIGIAALGQGFVVNVPIHHLRRLEPA
jgi:transcription antitermination factor NusG